MWKTSLLSHQNGDKRQLEAYSKLDNITKRITTNNLEQWLY
jgi:hypothetical protein